MKIRNIIMGEEMPNKNDPKYKERGKRDKEAGEKFAEKTGLNWFILKIQLWANHHRVAFLAIVFGLVIGLFAFNIFRVVNNYNHSKAHHRSTAVEQVDRALQQQQNNKYNDEGGR